jgi:putative oxidoreductase
MYIILIRIAVGLIFLSEGIQKFLFASELGERRFDKIGIPYPEVMGPLVGVVEILCGFFVLIGYKIRYTILPLILIMIVAISVTKIVNIPKEGFWVFAHGARTDFAMLLSGLFLYFSGGGKYSVDEYLLRKK